MISSVGFSSATLSVSSLQQKTTSSSTSATSFAPQTGDSAEISGPGQLFAALKELASEDPEKFKSVAADIAAKIRSAIGDTSSADSTDSADSTSSTDSTSATSGLSRLEELAAKFEEAAQTGDVSVLAPPSGGHRGGVGAYNRQGQPQGPPPPPPTDSSNGIDIKSLFDSINEEVSQALSA